MPQLHNLHRPHQPLNPTIIQPLVPSILETLFQIRSTRLFQTKHAGPRLVEDLHKADIEVRCVGAERKVHGGQRMLVRAVEQERAAGGGPQGAVGDVGCFVDVCAWGE